MHLFSSQLAVFAKIAVSLGFRPRPSLSDRPQTHLQTKGTPVSLGFRPRPSLSVGQEADFHSQDLAVSPGGKLVGRQWMGREVVGWRALSRS